MRPHPILCDLNPPQREAVECTEGPLLVLAGAGSGKTRVLTRRVAWLLETGRAERHEVLAVTFTNKAAGEMKERVEHLCGSGHFPYLGTFHSLCARWLRRHGELLGLSRQFSIYDTSEQAVLMRGVLREMGLDPRLARTYLARVGHLKNRMVSPAVAEARASDPYARDVARAYARYQELLQANQAMDFDDLLNLAVVLFREHGEVADLYRERLRYILIDEFQDVNRPQYALVQMLARDHRNLCCVGDDDQSIYAFRGADLSILLRFEKDYPEARIIKLEQNYRSTRPILDLGNAVVAENRARRPKRLWTDRAGGSKPVLHTAADGREEARFIVRTLADLAAREGRAYSEFVILYRTNAQSRLLEEVLIQEAIPYQIVGGLRFFDRKEIRDVIAYLRVLQNPADRLSLQRIANVPARGVGAASWARLREHVRKRGISLLEAMAEAREAGVRGRAQESLPELAAFLKDLAARSGDLTVTEIIRKVLEGSGYRRALEEDGSVEAQARLENLDELLNVASEYDRANPEPDLEGFLAEVSLLSDQDTYEEEAERVTLMTVHAAKGLEFPVVFLAGMEEEIFPHARCLDDPGQLEEERRLCYVAVTRAKDRLFITHARLRTLQGEPRRRVLSRFIRGLPEGLVEQAEEASPREEALPAIGSGRWRGWGRSRLQGKVGDPAARCGDTPWGPGTRVVHRIFGSGTVARVDRGLVTVAFDDGRQKTVAERFLTPAGKEPKPPGSSGDRLRVGDRVDHPRWGRGVVKAEEGEDVVVVFPSLTVHMSRAEARRA